MKIIYGASSVNLADSLLITIVSMATVFMVLILISFILSLFKYIPSEKDGTEKLSENKAITGNFSASSMKSGQKIRPEDIKDDKMLAAVTVAVIEAAGEEENAYIKVKSIREIN